ncbi:hypothetical protein BJ944DRAFT_43397 [Cunninghamella echinulata]|nr:hypothetical protein BJ944DRAFT_43397 [Cunninghamella echinulata]
MANRHYIVPNNSQQQKNHPSLSSSLNNNKIDLPVTLTSSSLTSSSSSSSPSSSTTAINNNNNNNSNNNNNISSSSSSPSFSSSPISSSTSHSSTSSSPTRPIIPELQIDFPSTEPIPKLTSTIKQEYNNKLPLLPSPSALSNLPVSESPNLSPMYTLHYNQHDHALASSLPTSTNSTSINPSSAYPHPRTLPLPSPLSPPISHSTIKSPSSVHHYYSSNNKISTPNTSSLEQEIIQLKQQHTKELELLHCKIHDLQVQNKLLYNLVLGQRQDHAHDGVQQQQQQQQQQQDFLIPSSTSLKRSRQSSIESTNSLIYPLLHSDPLLFNKKQRSSI